MTVPHTYRVLARGNLLGPVAVTVVALAVGCTAPNAEDRARAVAADIQASIRDFDGPALDQKTDKATVLEIEKNLTTLKEFMDEPDGKIDQVLVNAIQAFQRKQNEAIPWWRSWDRSPDDGLITEDLRRAIAAAAAAA